MATSTRRRRVTGRDFDDDAVEEEETTTRRRRRRPEPEVDEEETVEAEEQDTADEEDDDEEPAPRKRRLKKSDDVEDEPDEDSAFDDSLIARGWKEAKKAKPKGDWTNDFKFSDDPRIVKFLDNEPWSYGQHWVQREGKRGFPCRGAGCPLCKVGVKVTQKFVFPVVDLGESPDDAPQVVNLQVGQRLFDQLEQHDGDPKVGPLTRLYWSMSRSGKGLKTTYSVLPVKERDLEEDWEYDLDEVENFLSQAKAPEPKDAITWYSAAALQEIADEIME